LKRGDRAGRSTPPQPQSQIDDPTTWRTHDQAATKFASVSVMLNERADLDACIDDDFTRTLGRQVVDRLIRTLRSPSGRGLKILFYGPPGKTAEVSFGEPVDISDRQRELAFTGARYFTITKAGVADQRRDQRRCPMAACQGGPGGQRKAGWRRAHTPPRRCRASW
jgi:hypothetical protein